MTKKQRAAKNAKRREWYHKGGKETALKTIRKYQKTEKGKITQRRANEKYMEV
jgi:hypothetical protein